MQLKENIRDYCDPLKDRNRNKEYNKIKSEVNSFEEAYDLIEKPEYCGCSKKAKFVSLKLGYSKYCSYECLHKDNFYNLDNIKINIDKLSGANVKKLVTLYNKTQQELYDLLYSNRKCEKCNNDAIFYSLTKGYSKYCSISCSNKDKNYSRTEDKNNKIQAKRKETTLQKYGVEHNFQLIDNTGENNIMSSLNKSEQSKIAKNKKIETLISRYGSPITNISKTIINRCDLNQEYIINNFVVNNKFDLQSAMDYFKTSRTYFNKFSLPKKINYGEYWVHNLIGGKKNDRTLIKPLEIDVLNDSIGIGVEFDGLMFHSFGISNSSIFNNINTNTKNKHLIKTEECESKNIQLFHVFENEFLDKDKREIWESIFNYKLDKSNKIYARKCVIKEISSKESSLFLEKNHLQGKCNSSIRIGLFYNNELVSLMSFGKSRYNKNYQYELIRFCSKINNTVIGGASRLLKYFETKYKPKSLISYANRRWSQGNLYKKLGFDFIKNTEPNFFYFIPGNNRLLSRVSFQKHKLKDILEKFDDNESATMNIFKNGYRKIYDCGNKVYIKEYDE